MRGQIRITAAILTVLLLILPLCGCSEKPMEKAVGTCAGYDVLYEELRYVTLSYRDAFEETYGEGIWDDPVTAEKYRAELEETVLRVLRNNYAVLYACSQYMPDVTPDNKTIKEAVDSQIAAAVKEYGGEEAFLQAMDELHMTEHFVRFTLAVGELENELLYVLTQDLGLIIYETEEFADWMANGNVIHVQHVFIRNDKGDDPEANRALAESTRQQLAEGKDIGEVINSRVNEDLSNTAPYFMVRGVYAEALETEAVALQNAGDVSEVVEVENGFYIMERMEDDPKELLTKTPTLLKSYQWAELEKKIEGYRDSVCVERNEYGKSLDLVTLS